MELSLAQNSTRTTLNELEPTPTMPVHSGSRLMAGGHRMIRFSGTALDAQKQPVTGVAGVTFAIYEEQTGGAPLWQETQSLSTDAEGRYTALLGEMSADGIPSEALAGGDSRWLGVLAHAPGAVEQPRVLLVSVPYAMRAEDSQMLGGKPASAYVTRDMQATAQVVSPRHSGGVSTVPVADLHAPVVGIVASGATSGYVPVFTDAAGDVVNSAIAQSGGNIGIGTTTPDKTLTVNGAIHSTSGGFVFPDGTVMTTAATPTGSGSGSGSGSTGTQLVDGNLVLPAGVGTNGAGNVQLQTLNTATNTPVDRLLIAGTAKAMTGGGMPKANLFSVHVGAGDAAGGRVKFTIVASDGTNYAMETGEFVYLATPKQMNCTVILSQYATAPPTFTNTVLAVPAPGQSGFLDAQCKFATFDGDPGMQIYDTAPTSFTPTTHKVYYTIENQSQSAITLQP